MLRAWKRLKRWFRPPQLTNIGDFWCLKHFNMILESQKTYDPIDYHIATMGVGRFITLSNDYEIEGPLKNACERVPKEVLEGIFERSKGWL
jgi:hypothetical protein